MKPQSEQYHTSQQLFRSIIQCMKINSINCPAQFSNLLLIKLKTKKLLKLQNRERIQHLTPHTPLPDTANCETVNGAPRERKMCLVVTLTTTLPPPPVKYKTVVLWQMGLFSAWHSTGIISQILVPVEGVRQRDIVSVILM